MVNYEEKTHSAWFKERLRGVRSIKIGAKREQVDKTPAKYCAEHRKDTSFSLKLQQNKLIISMTKNSSFVTIDKIKYPVEIVYSCCFNLKTPVNNRQHKINDVVGKG